MRRAAIRQVEDLEHVYPCRKIEDLEAAGGVGQNGGVVVVQALDHGALDRLARLPRHQLTDHAARREWVCLASRRRTGSQQQPQNDEEGSGEHRTHRGHAATSGHGVGTDTLENCAESKFRAPCFVAGAGDRGVGALSSREVSCVAARGHTCVRRGGGYCGAFRRK